ncbi:hypothetical protein [Paenirhodobacter sp.]|uniref:hypothetical protein n=1 Tax=Paenirhodobacter sp. TaxID=1965326 RepID=UPI003B3F90B7
MMRIALALLFCLLAGTATAGPWPRAPGGVFASLSREIRSGDDWDALYVEYGWNERMTFVLDAGRSQNGGWIAILSTRIPLWTLGRHHFAVSVGGGKEHVVYPGLSDDIDPNALLHYGMTPGDYMLMQYGASWGMGFDSRFGSGWATLDGTLRKSSIGNREERKLDATLGVNLSDSNTLFSQAQYSWTKYSEGQLRLGLGWVRHFGPLAIEAGIGKRLRLDRETDAKIGLWLTF